METTDQWHVLNGSSEIFHVFIFIQPVCFMNAYRLCGSCDEPTEVFTFIWVFNSWEWTTQSFTVSRPTSESACLMQRPQNSILGASWLPLLQTWASLLVSQRFCNLIECQQWVCVCEGVGTLHGHTSKSAPWPMGCVVGSCVTITEGHNQRGKFAVADSLSCPGQQELLLSAFLRWVRESGGLRAPTCVQTSQEDEPNGPAADVLIKILSTIRTSQLVPQPLAGCLLVDGAALVRVQVTSRR